MLNVEGVHKSYGEVDALRGAGLTVEQGQIVALLGRNGAGKTTLVSIIAGLLRPDAGSVTINGVDALTNPTAVAKDIGLAPQETGIYRVLSVRENLEFFGQLAGLSRSDCRRRAEEVAGQLELAELFDRKARQLSGGEARRLHTACALVHRPALLMLDEPTVGADVASRQRLIETVAAMADEGAAVIYTTHYLGEVEALDADIVMIHEGRIRTRGTRAELIEQHHRGGLRFAVQGDVDPMILAGLDIISTRVEGAPTGGGNSGNAAPKTVTEDTVTEYTVAGDVRMADLISRFGASAHQLLSVERNLPNLERVFLSITGEAGTEDDGSLGGDSFADGEVR